MVKGGPRILHPQSIWDEESVLDAFATYGINKQHHDRFMREIYEQWTSGKMKKLSDFVVPPQMTPKLYNITNNTEDWALMTTKIIKREDSRDKSTTKLLIELQDGNLIETVLMRYSNTLTQEHTRTTICVSSQVGCAQSCSFCATGTIGLKASLRQGEILEQFVWCDSQIESVRNVVFMGQGEPLSNDVYKNVMSTVKIMTVNTRFSLRQNRVTVSTVGVVDNMYRTIDECPGITIALSLHAPTQTMRQRIVPSARKYSLKELVEVIDYYFDKTKKKMLIEYVMLGDVNSSEETAHQLGKLLQNRGALVNLIPFNPVLTKANHVAPSHETVANFAAIVASYGLVTTTRKEFGQDINGACGQLSSGVQKNTKKTQNVVVSEETGAEDEEVGPDGVIIDDSPGYKITDDFTADEVAVIPGYQPRRGAVATATVVDETGKNTEESTKNEENNGEDDLTNDDYVVLNNRSNDDDDYDVVDNGLEGLVSAFGWMNPEEKDQKDQNPDGNKDQDGKYIDTTEVGFTRESILDNTTGCGGDSSTTNTGGDIEDLLSAPSQNSIAKKMSKDEQIKAMKNLSEEEKIKFQLQTPVCEDNCGCHRELKHKQVTEGLDPKDVMAWSLAVLSLGPVLKHEQVINLKKKGETERGRIKRLFEQQLLGSNDENGNQNGENDENMDRCVGGDDDEELDHFDENTPLNNNITRVTNDNMSQTSGMSGMTGISMTSSQFRATKGAVSSLKIQPREKDMMHRIVMPKKAAVEAAKQQPQMDLDKVGWDATPETYRHKEEEKDQKIDDEKNKKIQTSSSPQNVLATTATSVEENDQHKKMVLAFIAIIIALIAARRVM